MKTSKSTIRLTESEFKKVVSETIKGIISEIDWKTVDSASHKANYEYDYDTLMYRYEEFEEAAREFMKALYKSPKGSGFAEELETFLIDVRNFCERKSRQADSLSQHSDDKFMNTFGKTRREMDDHIYDLYMQHGSDNMEDREWRRENLSPEENDYYDNN